VIKSEVTQEILTYILKFDDPSPLFLSHLTQLLQKLIHICSLHQLKLSTIFLIFSKLPPLIQSRAQSPLCLNFLSLLNSVLILSLERSEIR
jgi:hypothetical protein